MDAAMEAATQWLALGYLAGLGFVVLILITRGRGGE